MIKLGFLYYSKKAIQNPFLIVARIWVLCSKIIKSDILFLKVYYWLRMGEKLDLIAPKTFNQKIQWLKIYDRNPGYSQMVDKFCVREMIKEKLGEEYLIPLLGVWDKFNDINFDELPSQFVLKTTHDSGNIVIVRDKKAFIEGQEYFIAKKKLVKALNFNYFYKSREYPYKNLNSRIIAEKFMVNEKGEDLVDYKFFCFGGEPKVLFIASERFSSSIAKFDYFDINFNRLPFASKGHPHVEGFIPKPRVIDEMIKIAKKLSHGIPHVRVDLYNVNTHIYFGEFTFYHDGGVVPFVPKEWDEILGSWIKLPTVEK